MKKQIKFLGIILALSTTIILSACSDDDKKGDNGNQENTANMTGKVNGTAFSWTGNALINEDLMSLSANGKTFVPRIMLVMSKDVVEGESYQIIPFGDYKATYTNDEGKTNLADDGVITITEYNKTKKTIKGTFNFSTSEPAYSITEGSFNYVYEIQ